MTARSELDALRELAAGRDWGQLQSVLERALAGMEYFDGLTIALERAHAYLPIFEAAHPESTWARGLLVWLASYGVAPADLLPAASAMHASPGAANYISALIDLARSAERRTPFENRLRFLATALANLMLADLAARWYGQHPDQWDLQQRCGDDPDPATDQPVRLSIYARFWLDEDTARHDTSAWLQLADQLDERMNRIRSRQS